ncbi:MAG: twin-arginine translocase subunit TatC [Nitrososphaeria archaeon]
MPGKEMTILEHIEELRQRLIRIFAVVVGLALFFFLFEIRFLDLGHFNIPYPYPNIFHNTAAGIIKFLEEQVLPSYVKIIVTSPSEALISEMLISMILGVVVGMPVIVYEVWAFVAPALYEHEKRIIVKLTLPVTILFIVGCIFGYFFLVPFAFEFLYLYASSIGIITYITINDFIMFIALLCIAMGITFEVPAVMWGLTKLGIVNPDSWKKYFWYFVVFSIIYGAFITPDGSGITMWFVAIPMIVLYVLGYYFSKKAVK